MKKLSFPPRLLVGFALLGCILLAGGVAEAAPGDTSEERLSRETRQELTRARRATAKYHDISAAVADGYADINVFVPHVGFHYLRPSELDAEFDPERPELLVYAQDLCENRMR